MADEAVQTAAPAKQSFFTRRHAVRVQMRQRHHEHVRDAAQSTAASYDAEISRLSRLAREQRSVASRADAEAQEHARRQAEIAELAAVHPGELAAAKSEAADVLDEVKTAATQRREEAAEQVRLAREALDAALDTQDTVDVETASQVEAGKATAKEIVRSVERAHRERVRAAFRGERVQAAATEAPAAEQGGAEVGGM